MTMPDAPSSNPAPLQYGRRQPLMWASRHRGKLIGLALLLSAAMAIQFYWAPLKLRAQWLYWSHRCATFQMPAQTEASVRDSREANRLISDPNYVFTLTSAGTRADFSPQAARELAKIDPRFTAIGSVLFVGKLHRPDGMPRLICLSAIDPNGMALLATIEVTVIPPPG